MTNPSPTQSQKRYQESLAPLFEKNTSEKQCIFLRSSSDVGVVRNGGRNGARFAPQSFLSTFRKFAQTETLMAYSFKDYEVSRVDEEKADFHGAQKKEAERISKILQEHPKARICHIGGGHDHVYPLLKALSSSFSKIVVINIDAHADTRTDDNFHSGTPFRQFAGEFSGNFHIFQIGLHPFANSFSTISPLSKGESHAIWRKDVSTNSLMEMFLKIEKLIDDKTAVIFSLDADALTGHEVPGVSAVNPEGLSKKELSEIWELYAKLPLKHETILGIYELNPLYDTLASLSMRTLGSFVFESL